MRAQTNAGAAPRWAQVTSLVLSLAVVGVASYLTVTHYSDPAALACPDTGVVNCTLVTTSSWSVVLGVPVALWGLVWALVMTGLTLPWAWRTEGGWPERARTIGSALGALTVIALVYIELFEVGAICLWCSAVHVLTIALFGVVLAARASRRREVAVPA